MATQVTAALCPGRPERYEEAFFPRIVVPLLAALTLIGGIDVFGGMTGSLEVNF